LNGTSATELKLGETSYFEETSKEIEPHLILLDLTDQLMKNIEISQTSTGEEDLIEQAKLLFI
jgi:hypothetical protein